MLKMSIICGFKPTVNFQDPVPSPQPVYSMVLKTLSTIMFLTRDLRTLHAQGQKEHSSNKKPFLYTAVKYSMLFH